MGSQLITTQNLQLESIAFSSKQAPSVEKIVYLYNVSGCFTVQATSPNTGPFKIYMHIPIAHLNQVPILLSVYSDPIDIIENYKISSNYSYENSLLEVSINNLENTDIAYIYWNVPVLIEHNKYEDLPAYAAITPDYLLPEEVVEYLESTEYVQSENPEIVSKTEQLIGNDTNVITIAETIANFSGIGIIFGSSGTHDALTVLNEGAGVCVGKANLASALLRSLGIPARSIFIGPLIHYLIEFYIHPYGWVRLESTGGVTPWPFHTATITYCVDPQDETSQSVQNGLGHYNGWVVYWGTTNPSVQWGIIGERCSVDHYRITTTQDNFEHAINLTKNIWKYNKEMIGDQSSTTSEKVLARSKKYQNEAINSFLKDDFEGYLESMTKALSIFDGTSNNLTVIISSISAGVVLIGIIVITVYVWKKKENRGLDTPIDS
ncbi:MAG: transglutaminase-like domain-containing protein [Candidatus Heimdallarchaeaceae archaeon]